MPTPRTGTLVDPGMSNINRLRMHVQRAEREADEATAAFESETWGIDAVGRVNALRKMHHSIGEFSAFRQAWQIVTGEEWPW